MVFKPTARVPPSCLETVCYFDDAPRVSGTPEPCGARIAAQIEVLSLRPARNAARLTLWFRDLRGWN